MTDDLALFVIVPLPPPGPAREALLRDAIAYGGSDELLRKFFACEATERHLANQQAQTAEVASRVAEVGAHLMDMTEALTVRQDKQRRLDAKRKRDAAEAEAARVAHEQQQNVLDEINRRYGPEPAVGDDGELTIHEPVELERYDPEADEEEPSRPALFYGRVPLSYIPGQDDLDPEPPLDPKQIPQPVAISLNEA
jgi:hypothetical protein